MVVMPECQHQNLSIQISVMLYHIYFPKLSQGSATGRFSQWKEIWQQWAVCCYLIQMFNQKGVEQQLSMCNSVFIVKSVRFLGKSQLGRCSFNLRCCYPHASIHRSKQAPVIITFRLSCSSYDCRQVRTRTTYHIQGRSQEHRPIRTCKWRRLSYHLSQSLHAREHLHTSHSCSWVNTCSS